MIAIAGGKGGCGKTTTALGLAGALVRQRKPALAVDADREMPDLHAMAGVTRDPGLDAVAAGWSPRLVAGTAEEPTPGVRVVPAASGPSGRGAPSGRRRTPLARLRGFDVGVLLDCPAGAGPDAVAPLRVADAAVVVTTTEPACLRDAAKTAAMARELGTPVAGAVVSRAEQADERRSSVRETQAGDAFEGIATLLDCPVLGGVPDVEPRSGVESGSAEESVAGTASSATTTPRPLADDRVRAAHDRLLSALQPKYL